MPPNVMDTRPLLPHTYTGLVAMQVQVSHIMHHEVDAQPMSHLPVPRVRQGSPENQGSFTSNPGLDAGNCEPTMSYHLYVSDMIRFPDTHAGAALPHPVSKSVAVSVPSCGCEPPALLNTNTAPRTCLFLEPLAPRRCVPTSTQRIRAPRETSATRGGVLVVESKLGCWPRPRPRLRLSVYGRGELQWNRRRRCIEHGRLPSDVWQSEPSDNRARHVRALPRRADPRREGVRRTGGALQYWY